VPVETSDLKTLGRSAERSVHHDLDRFFGTCTKEEAAAFDQALREQRQIDS